MPAQSSDLDVATGLSDASTKPFLYSKKVPQGREVSASGLVFDNAGDKIGKLTQGRRGECAGLQINDASQVVNAKGHTVGTVALLSDRDATFRARVQSLPGELFYAIVDEVFTPSDDAVFIEKGAKASSLIPSQLHVNKASREMFARRWYAGRIFVVNSAIAGDNTCRKWLCSLPREHRGLIEDIYLDSDRLQEGLVDGSLQPVQAEGLAGLLATAPLRREHRARYDAMRGVVQMVRKRRLDVEPEVFKMWVCPVGSRGWHLLGVVLVGRDSGVGSGAPRVEFD